MRNFHASINIVVVYGGFVTHYCGFEDIHMCNYTKELQCHECWYRGTGRQNANSGPMEDHTFGTPKGIKHSNKKLYSCDVNKSYNGYQ